jgi:hypothetical protein
MTTVPDGKPVKGERAERASSSQTLDSRPEDVNSLTSGRRPQSGNRPRYLPRLSSAVPAKREGRLGDRFERQGRRVPSP